MLGSYGGGMLSIVFGISQIVYLSFMGPADIDAVQASLFKRAALFALLMLPLTLLLIAALCAGVGFTGALWLGNVLWMKGLITACYAALLFILFLIIVALC
ncbi:hypothetical protein EDC04DRAFT_2676699 [Pisolithus marmoratus]|nr:hypothetical protein EDC04DRAFT_2676699 [Pisolithus marmoratus]